MTPEIENCQTGRAGAVRLLQPGDTWRALFLRARILIPFFAAELSYLVTNRISAIRPDTRVLAFPFDPALPIIPAFVYIYLSYHLFVILSLFRYLLLPDKQPALRRFVVALFSSMMVGTLIFLIMPTSVPRPALIGDSLTQKILRLLYSTDEPFNCFPSMHVAWTFVSCFYQQKLIGRRWLQTLGNWLLFILISLSTVLIRQHYTPDVIGGLILGIAAVKLAESQWINRRQT